VGIDRERFRTTQPCAFFVFQCGLRQASAAGVCAGNASAEEIRRDGGIRGTPKDTLRNIRETKEFVINVVTSELAEAMNLTSGDYDASIDEFELAGVASAPSKVVRPQRVAESPVSFECKLHQILDFNTGPEAAAW